MGSSKDNFKFVEHPFEPVYDNQSRILILGTMPSPKSRKDEFYYGHSGNRFWRVFAGIFAKPIPKTKKEKIELLLSNNLALWDVLKSCYIDGAKDSSISNPAVNDFSTIFEKAKIERILCNGKKAFELYSERCKPQTGVEVISLFSTSSANVRADIDTLTKAYRDAILL